MSTASHWEGIHSEKLTDVSWWQTPEALWFDLIERTGVDKSGAVIDVGGGSSLLVDALVSEGFTDVTLLDIAQAALDRVEKRIGSRIHYICSDVTTLNAGRTFDLWHDRAVFHFLTTDLDRMEYRKRIKEHTKPGSWVVLSTFAEDGPEKCSGLDVQRYSEPDLASSLGPDFVCHWTERRTHITPWGSEQKFVTAGFKRQ